ncbi:hypothetical protein WMF15_04230 [Sorangium sp. So ce233]
MSHDPSASDGAAAPSAQRAPADPGPLLAGGALDGAASSAAPAATATMASAVASADDAALVRRLLAGDEQAFEQLVTGLHTPMLRLARTLAGSAGAQEVVQETWAAVFDGLVRGDGVVEWRKARVHPVGIDERPVLRVCIGVPRQDHERHATNKLLEIVLPRERADDGADACIGDRDVGGNDEEIFLLGLDLEDLCKVLLVNSMLRRCSIEAPDQQGAPLPRELGGEVLDRCHLDDAVVRHIQARDAAPSEHRQLVLGEISERRARKFCNLPAALPGQRQGDFLLVIEIDVH